MAIKLKQKEVLMMSFEQALQKEAADKNRNSEELVNNRWSTCSCPCQLIPND